MSCLPDAVPASLTYVSTGWVIGMLHSARILGYFGSAIALLASFGWLCIGALRGAEAFMLGVGMLACSLLALWGTELATRGRLQRGASCLLVAAIGLALLTVPPWLSSSPTLGNIQYP